MAEPAQRESKRQRATVIAMRDGKLLLVRGRGSRRWSLPGGGLKKNETPLAAGIREVWEETGLTCQSVKYLFHHESLNRSHSVCYMDVWGRVKLQEKEVSDHCWVNAWPVELDSLALSKSAKAIIARAHSILEGE